ncbi:hypothetical protein KSP40_PGU007414 [Platanthera guangdongensis]|uniref:Uncharacterized protein n=1 Tax=Platanthera guangdongensis TaxID=2320717 RepID=A0ABR2LX58_9ASPA
MRMKRRRRIRGREDLSEKEKSHSCVKAELKKSWEFLRSGLNYLSGIKSKRGCKTSAIMRIRTSGRELAARRAGEEALPEVLRLEESSNKFLQWEATPGNNEHANSMRQGFAIGGGSQEAAVTGLEAVTEFNNIRQNSREERTKEGSNSRMLGEGR